MGLILKKYYFSGKEYVICDLSAEGCSFNAAQIHLLCDRRQGIGADLFLLALANGAKSHLQAYTTKGIITDPDAMALRVYSRYLQEAGWPVSQVEVVKALGDRAVLECAAVAKEARVIEVRVTASFCRRLEALSDQCESCVG